MILQQEFPVEFQLVNQTCDRCQRVASNQAWKALVQLRQKVPHKVRALCGGAAAPNRHSLIPLARSAPSTTSSSWC